jgi:DNA phosphorothioation-dependent restriction protein DptG
MFSRLQSHLFVKQSMISLIQSDPSFCYNFVTQIVEQIERRPEHWHSWSDKEENSYFFPKKSKNLFDCSAVSILTEEKFFEQFHQRRF